MALTIKIDLDSEGFEGCENVRDRICGAIEEAVMKIRLEPTSQPFQIYTVNGIWCGVATIETK